MNNRANKTSTPARTPASFVGRFLAWSLALLLLTTAVIPHAAAATTSLPPLGMSMESAQSLKDAGAAPRYGSFWVGNWVANSGWGGVDGAMRTAKATGTVPVLFWYYWGDAISPNCVNYGCEGRSQSQWMSMTDTLANHVRNEMGGKEVIIVLENEFNKGGIDGSYAPTFDAKLETVAKKLKAVPGVRLVVGFGAWGESNWVKFPKTIAQSEFVGFQMMRASTKDTEAQYRGAADRINQLTNYVSTKFNKPSFLYDLALSSYPDAKWEKMQGETLSAVFDSIAISGSVGLKGVLYRTLVDNPSMPPKNYYGYAEQHWGLKKAYGQGDKPSWAVWKAKATGGSAPSSPTSPTNPPADGGALDATFESVKVDEWWVQVSVKANKAITKVDARVNGGTWVQLDKQTWGAYAKSINVKAGQSAEFRATATDGSTDISAAFARGGGTTQPAPAPAPSGLDAQFESVKVDEWWVQVSVKANKAITKVDARVNGGTWVQLDKQTWGAYAKSINVKAGQSVEFRATATDGSTDISAAFARGGGTTQPAPAPAPSGLDAQFTSIKVDEWWVQVSVTANKAISKVEARVNGGTWVQLDKQSWGAYAKSINVKDGQSVEFRATATDGSTDISEKIARGGGGTPAPAPAPSGFDANFASTKVNEWWVQVSVTGNKAISKVEVRVNGGGWVQLDKQTWGAYAKSVNVKAGQSVEFRATATDGSTDISQKFART